jgi:hypothetical protein
MDDDTASATELLPYEVITDPRYSAAVFRLASASLSVLVLRGTCPRCAVLIDIPVLDPVLGGNRTMSPGMPSSEDEDDAAPLLCTCREAHPGRPDEAIGCGAYWNAVLPLTDQGAGGQTSPWTGRTTSANAAQKQPSGTRPSPGTGIALPRSPAGAGSAATSTPPPPTA